MRLEENLGVFMQIATPSGDFREQLGETVFYGHGEACLTWVMAMKTYATLQHKQIVIGS